MHRLSTHRAALLALMLTVAAVFWRHLFTGDVLFLRDISSIHFPRAVELREVVRQGSLPLWNPYEHFGESVVVNPNYLLFYPTTWLAWILPAAYGFKLHYVLHFFLLAAGSFLLGRRLGLGAFACYVAGAVFVFSGPIMSLGNFYNLLPAAAWMPLALLAADSLGKHGGWREAGILAVSLALQLFAGEPLTSLVTVALVLAWVLAFHGPLRTVWVRALAAVGLAGGLAAIQLLPALWHIQYTPRGQFSYEHTFFWSLHPLQLLDILLPNFWGSPLAVARPPWLYLEGRERFLFSVFIGIFPLALAAIGAWSERSRPAASRFWLIAGLVSVLIALGRFTPL